MLQYFPGVYVHTTHGGNRFSVVYVVLWCCYLTLGYPNGSLCHTGAAMRALAAVVNAVEAAVSCSKGKRVEPANDPMKI